MAEPYKRSVYEKYIKRSLDIMLSGAALIGLSPVLGTTALLVRKKLGTPVIFRQERPGLHEELFDLYKFRSMTDATDAEGNLLPDEERLTTFGRKLRSTSLDELPELWNIFKGDMSIVGPRPLLVEYLPYYTEEESHRHDIRPGLTGWAQVNGRSVTGWDERLAQDVYYVKNCSFLLDLKIVLMTVYKVMKRSDIRMGNEHTPGKGKLYQYRSWMTEGVQNEQNK